MDGRQLSSFPRFGEIPHPLRAIFQPCPNPPATILAIPRRLGCPRDPPRIFPGEAKWQAGRCRVGEWGVAWGKVRKASG